MRASEAVKEADKVLNIFCNYANLAREWEVRDETDFENLRDEVIDSIAGNDEEE